MNKERVQTLEALLTRVKRNAAEPRPARARRAEAPPIGAETRGAAAPKPVAAEPVRAAPAQPVARAQPMAPVTAPAASPPKVTPRLIDPVAAPAEDPAKWTLDEFGSEPAPSPKPAPAASKPVAAAQPKPVAAAARPAAPAPAQGARAGLLGFPRASKPEVAVPKAAPSSPGARPSAPAQEPLAAAVLAATTEEIPPSRRNLGDIQDEDEVEPTVAGQVPEDILQLSRAQRMPSTPPIAGVVEPARGESPKPAPVETVRPEPPVPPVDEVTLEQPPAPPLPREEPIAAEPPVEPPPPQPPIQLAVEPRPVAAAQPTPPVAAHVDSPKETPAFSSGGSEEEPSKFAREAGKPKAKKQGSITPYLVVAILAVLGCAAVIYKRRPDIFGIKPTPPSPKTAIVPSALPTSTAGATSTATATASAATTTAPTASAAPSASASAEASADAPPKDPKTLAVTEGYVFVKSSLEGDVYVGIHRLGPVNSWVVSSCIGAQFFRLGRPKGGGIEWTSEGKSSPVPCQGQTKVEITQVALPPAALPPQPLPQPQPQPQPQPPPMPL